MTIGKNWMGGNPGSWDNSGSVTSQRSPGSLPRTREGNQHSPDSETQLKHHSGLMLSISGKPPAGCNRIPGR